MKPEVRKVEIVSSPEEYTALGIPEEWVESLQKLGYSTIAKIKELEKPGKLHQEMMGYRKKNKLEIGTVLMEDVVGWITCLKSNPIGQISFKIKRFSSYKE